MKNDHSYFKNTSCEYFPCHKTDGENFNCLFCYCPLYAFGDKCGGNFTYTENGIKTAPSAFYRIAKTDTYKYFQSSVS